MIPCFFSRSFRASALGLPTLFHPPLDYARGIAFCRPTPPYALSFVGGTGSHGVRSGKAKSAGLVLAAGRSSARLTKPLKTHSRALLAVASSSSNTTRFATADRGRRSARSERQRPLRRPGIDNMLSRWALL